MRKRFEEINLGGGDNGYLICTTAKTGYRIFQGGDGDRNWHVCYATFTLEGWGDKQGSGWEKPFKTKAEAKRKVVAKMMGLKI